MRQAQGVQHYCVTLCRGEPLGDGVSFPGIEGVRGVAVGKQNSVPCYRAARFEQSSYRAAQSEEQGTLFCFSALAKGSQAVPEKRNRVPQCVPRAQCVLR